MPFRPPKERIDRLAAQLLSELQKAPGVQVKNAEAVKAVFRAVLVQNLQEEYAIEEEATALLRQHGQQIYEANADFQKMLQEGKKVLAKKKGFIL
ncbi:MAG TPA: DUF507 family protein [Salinarimonas sp.]|nr:DUF507 family protein [Salinarimonas sp.]